MLSDLLSQFGDSSVRFGLSIGVSLSLVGGVAYLRGSALYARAIENKG
jgi:hypothetical protein